MVSGHLKKAALRKTRMKKYIALHKEKKFCGTCRKECESNYLCCNICHTAHHQRCQKLSKRNFDKMRENRSFICSNICYMSVLPSFNSMSDIELRHFFHGNGKYPCKKCKLDILKHTPYIDCAVCEGFVHFECTKLSAEEFNATQDYFCSKKLF